MNLFDKIEKIEILYKEGNHDLALRSVKSLYRKHKSNVHVVFCFASMLFRLKKYDEALPLLRKVFILKPNDLKVLRCLAQTLYFCQLDDEANQIFEKLIQLEDENPVIWLLLGQLRYRQGNFLGAIEAYQRTLEIAPSSFKAHFEIVNLTKVIKDSPSFDFFLDKSENGSIREKTIAHFQLGKIYLDQNNIEKSFHHYKLANELVYKSQKNDDTEVSSIYKTEPRDRLIFNKNIFNHELLNNTKNQNNSRLIIICGTPRSGKSLCESILANHPKIHTYGESTILSDTFQELSSGTSTSNKTSLFFLRKFAEEIDKKIFLNKENFAVFTNPGHTWMLGYLSLAFPKAPIIFCYRNPLDLGVSIYFKHFKINALHPYNTNLRKIGEEIRFTEIMMQYWKKNLPNPSMLLSYADLVSDPSETAQKLCAHIGIEFHPNCLSGIHQVPTIAEALGPARSLDILQPVPIIKDYEGIGKRFEKYLAPLKDGYRNAK